eukprot:Hpha_TRINITY_DN15395_c0_g3::TRINITY_DN15395_c0_g3_i1::g.89740::m.89740
MAYYGGGVGPPAGGFGNLAGNEAQKEAERHRMIAQHLSSQLQARQQQPPLPYAPPAAGSALRPNLAPTPASPPSPFGGGAAPNGVRRVSGQLRQSPGVVEGTGSPPPQQGNPVVRTFAVLLSDRYGNRWYERDVTCSRASDLVGILERRLGMQLREVTYQGTPLTDNNFPFVPDDLRLDVTTVTDSASPRRTLTLFVEEAPRRVQVAAGSVQELCDRLREQGIQAERLLYKVRTPAGEDVFEPLVTLDSLSYEHHVRWIGAQQSSNNFGGVGSAPPSPPPAGFANTHPSLGGTRTPGGAPRLQPPPGRHLSPAVAYQPSPGDVVDTHRVMVEAGHLLMAALPSADDDEVAAATARVTQQFKQGHRCADSGRDLTPAEYDELRTIVDQYLASVAGAVGTGASVFKSVTFGIAGAFPQLDLSDADGRLQLVPPSVTVSGQPVVILAHAKADTMIDIRCTLGYEDEEGRVQVINLDEFYVNGWITIGKTSAASLFLAFQPDVLRAGVHYHLDLTSFLADQPGVKCGGAHCAFTIFSSFEEQRQRQPRVQPSHAASQRTNPAASGYGAAPAPVHAAAAANPAGGAFQDELREFVETKVLPLYQLSTNPRVTRAEFDQIVEGACAGYWDLPGDTMLDEDHKRGILARVKQGIVDSREFRRASAA